MLPSLHSVVEYINGKVKMHYFHLPAKLFVRSMVGKELFWNILEQIGWFIECEWQRQHSWKRLIYNESEVCFSLI